jgi:hypothetical protein
MKVTAFWNIAQRSLIEVYQRFKGAHCLPHQGDGSDDGNYIPESCRIHFPKNFFIVTSNSSQRFRIIKEQVASLDSR